jgi:hypothetical protein
MDFSSNNEKKNKRNRFLNIIFLGIFLAEIIIGIIGMVILPIKTDLLIIFVSITFVSGIYTVSCFLLLTSLFHIYYTKKFIFISFIK